MSDPRIRLLTPVRAAGMAPAKLNLFLEVLERRPDGYHELVTLFHEIDLCDEIEVAFRPAQDDDTLEVAGMAFSCDPQQNLALRAVRAFRKLAPGLPATHVRLVKRIPIGSGMGGGSSDAAWVLRALARLVPLSPGDTGAAGDTTDHAALHPVACELGADVAFFLRGGTAVGRGRGDELASLEGIPRRIFVLALPDFSIATASAYAHVNLIAPRADVSSVREGMTRRRPGESLAGCFNRLESAACTVEPRLAELLARLRSAGSTAWTMTGSGSTLFAPVADLECARLLVQCVTRSGSSHLRRLQIVQSFTG